MTGDTIMSAPRIYAGKRLKNGIYVGGSLPVDTVSDAVGLFAIYEFFRHPLFWSIFIVVSFYLMCVNHWGIDKTNHGIYVTTSFLVNTVGYILTGAHGVPHCYAFCTGFYG
jgi:hypothetical protein